MKAYLYNRLKSQIVSIIRKIKIEYTGYYEVEQYGPASEKRTASPTHQQAELAAEKILDKLGIHKE